MSSGDPGSDSDCGGAPWRANDHRRREDRHWTSEKAGRQSKEHIGGGSGVSKVGRAKPILEGRLGGKGVSVCCEDGEW